MKVREWLEAYTAGAVHHDWTELDLSDGTNHVRMRVSADAPRIRDVRHGAGAFGAQQLADAMVDDDGGSPESALMLTSVLVERRHHASSVVLDPIPLTKMPPAEKHSRLIDVAVQSAVPFTAWGAAPAQGRALEQLEEVPACVQLYGPRQLTWSVANVCKPFCVDSKCTATFGVNHGWIVHESQVEWRQNRGDGRPGHVWVAKVIPVYASKVLPGFFLIQDRGAAHFFGEHADQDDYASAPLFAHGWSLANGAWVPTRVLYTDARYAGLVTPDGQPLRSHRHPNVPPVVLELATRELTPPAPPASGPVTEPDPTPPSLRAELEPRERIVAWMLAHEGHTESPAGSNTSPLIDSWAEHCVRDGHSMGSLWTAKEGRDWCAVTIGGAIVGTRLPGDPRMPTPRISMSEYMADAKAEGRFVSLADILSGKVDLLPGWVLCWPRIDPTTGTITWKGHVDVPLRWVDRGKALVETIGGNVGNRIARAVRRLNDPVLPCYGAVRIPDRADASPVLVAPVSDTAELIEGIDVSSYQPPAKCDYSVLRRRFSWGISKASQGVRRDGTFPEHVRRQRAAGFVVGAYLFFEGDTPWSAQADVFSESAAAAGYGKPGDIVPALDLEVWQGFSADVYNDAGRKLARELALRFGGCMIYTNLNTIALMGYPAWLEEHELWLASQTSNPQPTGPERWAIWQWDAIRVDGFAGAAIDVNRARRLPLIGV